MSGSGSLYWRFNNKTATMRNDEMDRALLEERSRSRERTSRLREWSRAPIAEDMHELDLGDKIVIDMQMTAAERD